MVIKFTKFSMEISNKEKAINKIIDYIFLNSDGRLLATKPQGQSFKADLIVKRKGEYLAPAEEKKDSVFAKVKIFAEKKKRGSKEDFIFICDKKDSFDILNFANGENFYLLVVDFNIVKQDVEDQIKIVKLDKTKKEFLVSKKDLSRFFLDLT